MSELRTTSLSHKDNNTGVPNITMHPDGTTSLPGMTMGGFRNLLINGGMSVNQRGLTLYSAGRANDYTADRWLTSTGISVSWYSDTNFMPAGFTAAIEIGVTTGQNAVINQRIEQPNAGFWAAPGSTWTLSAWVDKPDNFELNLDYRNGANAILASFSKVGALVKGETDGIFTRVSQVFTAPAFTTGTEYTQANFANLTSGENTRFTGAQLEQGPVATVFELRPIGAELTLCQRYFQVIGAAGKTWDQVILSRNSTLGYGASVPFSTMRAQPTADVSNVTDVERLSGPGGTVGARTLVPNVRGVNSVRFGFDGFTPVTTTTTQLARFTGPVFLDAEL